MPISAAPSYLGGGAPEASRELPPPRRLESFQGQRFRTSLLQIATLMAILAVAPIMARGDDKNVEKGFQGLPPSVLVTPEPSTIEQALFSMRIEVQFLCDELNVINVETEEPPLEASQTTPSDLCEEVEELREKTELYFGYYENLQEFFTEPRFLRRVIKEFFKLMDPDSLASQKRRSLHEKLREFDALLASIKSQSASLEADVAVIFSDLERAMDLVLGQIFEVADSIMFGKKVFYFIIKDISEYPEIYELIPDKYKKK